MDQFPHNLRYSLYHPSLSTCTSVFFFFFFFFFFCSFVAFCRCYYHYHDYYRIIIFPFGLTKKGLYPSTPPPVFFARLLLLWSLLSLLFSPLRSLLYPNLSSHL
ncbi:hypothetical protein HOY82DRAFT_565140, partial [Tuber indicum]